MGCRIERSEITDCKKDTIGGRIRYLNPNEMIEVVDFMKLDVRGNNVPYITGYTTETPL